MYCTQNYHMIIIIIEVNVKLSHAFMLASKKKKKSFDQKLSAVHSFKSNNNFFFNKKKLKYAETIAFLFHMKVVWNVKNKINYKCERFQKKGTVFSLLHHTGSTFFSFHFVCLYFFYLLIFLLFSHMFGWHTHTIAYLHTKAFIKRIVHGINENCNIIFNDFHKK